MFWLSNLESISVYFLLSRVMSEGGVEIECFGLYPYILFLSHALK